MSSGCQQKPTIVTSSEAESVQNQPQVEIIPTENPLPDAQTYIMSMASDFVAEHTDSSMNEVDKIEAIYCTLIEKIYFAEPPDRDYWMYHADPKSPPSYLYHHAMAPLGYGIGSCEDFAAALTLILQAAGFEAQYVSGLTISAKRVWVDHAWTVVKIGESWYHLDSQLEQNVIQNGQMTYRYFLRDDEWMLADHLWGKWLATYWQGKQTQEQRAILLDTMTPPLCQGKELPRPKDREFELNPPERTAVSTHLREMREAYLRKNTEIPTGLGEWIPPIFAIMPSPPN